MGSILSTVTVSGLWAAAGADVLTLVQTPIVLYLGIAFSFAAVGLVARLIMRAIRKVRAGV